MSMLCTALLLALRIALPGWLWLSPASSEGGAQGWFARGGRAGRIIVLGLLLNLAPALLLAQLTAWTPALDWLGWGMLVLAGAWRRRSAIWSRAGLGDLAAAGGWLALVVVVLLLLPPRSEWLAGGWDPGIYQNAAVVVDRMHGFAPRLDTVFALLTPEERRLFSTAENAYREVMPAVPIDTQTGALLPYFFPLMPLCGALVHRWGGIDLLVRINGLLAWFSLPVLLALTGVLRVGVPARLALVGAWLLSPLWWYHQAIPTTEMLQLLLMMGAVIFYADAHAAGRARPWVAAALLALSVINHFGYAALAAVLVLALAVGEAWSVAPGRVGRTLLCGAGLLAGAGWDLCFSGVTLHRLEDKGHVLLVVLLPLVVFLAAGVWLAGRGLPSRLMRLLGLGLRVGAAGFCAVVLVLWSIATCPGGEAWLLAAVHPLPLVEGVVTRLVRLLSFHGLAFLGPAALGGLALALSRDERTARLRLMAAGLLAVVLMLMANPGIAPIYPWAFRRSVVFLVPLLAAAHACLITARWPASWRNPQLGRVVPLILSASVLLSGWRASSRAAAVGDYVGLRAPLAAVAAQIRPGDVVIADEALWGTPLLMMHGHDVVDGGLLQRGAPEADREARLKVLARLARDEGRRLLWLTSGTDPAALYPFPMPGAQRLGEAQPLLYRTVIHSRRANAFAARENRKMLALWEWHP